MTAAMRERSTWASPAVVAESHPRRLPRPRVRLQVATAAELRDLVVVLSDRRNVATLAADGVVQVPRP